MKQLFTFIITIFGLVLHCKAESTEVFTNKDYNLYFFTDSTSKLNATQVLQNNLFTPLQQPIFKLSNGNKNGWVLIELLPNKTANKKIYSIFKEPNLDEIEFYEVTGGNANFINKTGRIHNFNTRLINNKDYVYLLEQKINDTTKLLFKVNSYGRIISVPVYLKSTSSYLHQSNIENFQIGLCIGVLVLIFVFTLFIYTQLKHSIYLLYAAYNLCAAVWILCNTGLFFEFFIPNYPILFSKLRFISSSIAVILMLSIMKYFLFDNAKNKFTKTARILQFIIICLIIPSFFNINFKTVSTALFIYLKLIDGIILFIIFILIASIVKAYYNKARTRIVTYYTFSVIAVITGMMLNILSRFDLIYPSYFANNFLYYGFIAEVIILSFGLAIKYYEYKKDKDAIALEIAITKANANAALAIAQQEERLRIAADMHDDLGAGLSGLKLMSESATKKTNTNDVRNAIFKIASTSSQLAEKIRDIIWTLSNEEKNLEDLIIYLHHYTKELLEDLPITSTVTIADKLPNVAINDFQKRNIIFIVKEAFNNIIKHANASIVDCRYNYSNSMLHINISDNGIGISEQKNGYGNGLSNMQKRINNLQGSMQINNSNGTIIDFFIPLKGNNLKQTN